MERAKHIAFMLSLFIGLFFIGTAINNDAWFLLNSGRYVAEFGIPHIEPFTMHEGLHYVMQQWLFALGLWKLYSVFGTAGLVAFSYLAGAVVLFLFHRLVCLTADGNRTAEFVIVVPVGIFLSLAFFCQRPQMASAAIFLIEIYLLERYKKETEIPKWLPAAFLLLSSLLVNMHAAMWPMMVVLLLPYAAEALLSERLAARLPYDAHWRLQSILMFLALVIAGGFLNPYGSEAMTYSFHALGNAEVQDLVSEMKPVSMAAGIGTGKIALAVMFVLTAVYARHPVPLRHLLLAAGTGFMALLSVRSLFLFSLFATFPLGRVLRDWHPTVPVWTRRRKCFCVLLFCGNVLLFAHVLAPRYAVPPISPQVAGGTAYLMERAAQAGRKPQDIRLFAGYSAGGYPEFLGFRCYMDPRAEVFFQAFNHQKAIFEEYYLLVTGLETPHAFLEGTTFDYLLVQRTEPLYAALAEDAAYELLWDSRAEGIMGEAVEDVRVFRKK